MDFSDVITSDEDSVLPPATPDVPRVSYEHTPAMREVMAAYVDFHSNVGAESMGPHPMGVPQGPAHARDEFLRFLAGVTTESVAEFVAELDEQESKQKGASNGL